MGKGALAFIAGLGTGYLNQRNREEEKARQEKIDQIALDRADRERSDYEEKQRLKQSISDAAKPGEIKYENVAHQGIPMLSAQDPLPGEEPTQEAPKPQPVASQEIGGYTRKVTFNGKEYADENAAKADIELYNKPEVRDARIVQAYRNAGDHQAALDIEGKTSRIKGDAIHNEASQLNLNQAKEQDARLTFGRGMVNAYSSGGGAGLMSFLSDSHADGESGAVKFEQQLSPDGKIATVFKTNLKGEKLKVGDVPNTDEGWQSAMFRLQRGLDPNALFAHSAALKKQELEERKVSATEKKADAAERRAEANDRKTDALIAGVIGSRGAGSRSSQNVGLTADDVEKASSTINARVTEIYQPKEGATQEERAALGVARNQAATEVTGIWKVNNKSGNSIDASTALYARDLAKDKNNLVTIPFQGGTYPGVVVNGVPVIVGEKLKPKTTQPEANKDGNMAANGIVKPKKEEIPAEPKKGEWVGNEWVLNPDHAAWKEKYAQKIQEQEAARNQRITRALDNPFIR